MNERAPRALLLLLTVVESAAVVNDHAVVDVWVRVEMIGEVRENLGWKLSDNFEGLIVLFRVENKFGENRELR